MTCFLTEVLFLFAEIAYDNKTNRALLIGQQGERDFVRFFRYLNFASGNTIFQFAALLWELWSLCWRRSGANIHAARACRPRTLGRTSVTRAN